MQNYTNESLLTLTVQTTLTNINKKVYTRKCLQELHSPSVKKAKTEYSGKLNRVKSNASNRVKYASNYSTF